MALDLQEGSDLQPVHEQSTPQFDGATQPLGQCSELSHLAGPWGEASPHSDSEWGSVTEEAWNTLIGGRSQTL